MANPLTTLAKLFVPQREDFKTLSSEFPDLDTQLAAIRAARARSARPYRLAGVQEALGVPAILSAVSLISNTVGSMSMEAYRDGVRVTDQQQVPRLIVRPNPKSTPREFWMKTAFYMATRGEFWWWVAHRDTDGNPDALYPVPPWEIMVEQNTQDRTRPKISWMGKVYRNEDMRHQMYLPGPDGLRGMGPLQAAGAAVSVTVEADAWAANFFSGALPSLIGTTDQDVDEIDLAALDAQWLEKPNNVPRWMTSGLKLEAPPYDAQRAQLTEQRQFQVGETARMFDMPGELLEYNSPGSSLQYQNQSEIWQDFQRRCLSPHYLEPIEQEMSDQMPRTTVGRFNLKQLLRADAKTRMEVHNIAIPLGIYDAQTAASEEGYAAGNVDFMPVPFSPPAADPGPIPMLSLSQPVRCSKCSTLLAEFASPPYRFTCRKCKGVTAADMLQAREDPALMMLTAIANREPTQAPVNVTIEAGAVAAPDMSGLVEAIRELAARNEAPAVHFDEGSIQVAAPDMSGVADALVAVADRPQPEIHVDAPAITVEAPQVTVNLPEDRGDTRTLKHDKDGRITEIVTKPN